MIRGIHHTAISTGDIDRLLHFYRDLLGFEEALAFNWDVGNEVADKILRLKDTSARHALLKAGNSFIEIFQYVTPPGKPGDQAIRVCDHGIMHICLDVTDVDREYERLKAAGMTFNCPPQDLGGLVRTTYGRDPDGNIVEIQEVTAIRSPISLE